MALNLGLSSQLIKGFVYLEMFEMNAVKVLVPCVSVVCLTTLIIHLQGGEDAVAQEPFSEPTLLPLDAKDFLSKKKVGVLRYFWFWNFFNCFLEFFSTISFYGFAVSW